MTFFHIVFLLKAERDLWKNDTCVCVCFKMYNWWKTFECLLYFCTKNAAESLTHVDLFTFKQSNLNRTASVDSVCYVSMATLFKTSIQELTV